MSGSRWRPDDPNQYIRINKKKFGAFRQIAIENMEKYGKSPSWEQIAAFIEKTGMTMRGFEKFYGIPFNTLIQIKCGGSINRNYTPILPPRFWGYIYEQIIPEYGVKYVLVKKSEAPKVEKYKPKRGYKKRNAKVIELENDTHNRLNKIK